MTVLAVFIYIAVFILYISLYTFSEFLFTYKVYLISNDKFKLSALASGLGLFISFSLYAFIPFLAVVIQWEWALVLIIALAVGNFLSNIVLNKVDMLHKKSDDKKKGVVK